MTAPPKMLFVIDYLSGTRGGTEGQLLTLIRGVARHGLAPQLAALQSTEYTRSSLDLGCPVSALDITRVLRLRSLVRLIRFAWWVRRERIELVHVFFNDSAMIIPWFAKLGGSKVIASRRDMGYWYTRGNLRLLRMANRFVDRFIVNSRAVAEHVMRRERVPGDRIRVIYNGYPFGSEEDPPLEGFRETLGIGPDDPVIGIVANLRPVKRHADILRAFAIVTRRFPRAHLLLVGSGPLEGELRLLATELGLRTVHFLGSLSHVIPVVKHFQVGVLCSESEGFSNALIEYMACGVPSVCTNVGGNPELIHDGVEGYLVELGDIPALASRIVTLLADPGLARTMGDRARARVEEYTLERMVSAHLESYAEIIRGGARS